MSLAWLMLALMVGLFLVCAGLVIFAEHVIAPPSARRAPAQGRGESGDGH